jgi:hypothetical protein
MLQRLGTWTVGLASGIRVGDATSGFRAFSREAALQINVFNPFTYTLETIIQSGNRNLGVQSVTIRTNPPSRPSRLYRGMGTYLRKSIVTVFRIYTLYKPLKTFFLTGSLLILIGAAIGMRFLWYFFEGDRGGHVQSLILAAVFLIVGFQTMLIGLVADLISVNRRLSEEVLIRLKKMRPTERIRGSFRDRQARPQPRSQPQVQAQAQTQTPAQTQKQETQWVWLLDEDKLEDRVPDAGAESSAPIATAQPQPGRRRRRRR